MKIAFPIEENKGLDSVISENFGKVREYLVVDPDAQCCQVTQNQRYIKAAGSCKSGKFDPALSIDAVITRCIGHGSLREMHDAGIKVYQATGESIAENLSLLEKGALKLFPIFDVCNGRSNKKTQGCRHHHESA